MLLACGPKGGDSNKTHKKRQNEADYLATGLSDNGGNITAAVGAYGPVHNGGL